jgi:hypothetical protein
LGDKPNLVKVIFPVYLHQHRFVKFSLIAHHCAEKIFHSRVNDLDERNAIHSLVEPGAQRFENIVGGEVSDEGNDCENNDEAESGIREIQPVVKPGERNVNEVSGGENGHNKKAPAEKVTEYPAGDEVHGVKVGKGKLKSRSAAKCSVAHNKPRREIWG